jgi:3-phytase
MTIMRVLAVAWLAALAGCAATDAGFHVNRAALDVPVVTVAEAWRSPEFPRERLDSLSTWIDPEGREYVLATAKDGERVVVYSATNGEVLRHLGAAEGPERLRRPNGIANAGGVIWVVERDAHRVRLLDPANGRTLGNFGEQELRFPYGIYVETIDAADGRYRAYVTDSYQNGKQVPPDAELGRRVHEFAVVVRNARLVGARPVRAFGATSGRGTLRIVESIHGDPLYDRLLVAEEDAAGGQLLKGYDFAGGFRDEVVGDGIYAYQPEGIALVACADGSGYWITSDQHPERQRFHVFERATLQHRGSFRGEYVRTTDGIWFEPGDFAGFTRGVLFAQHDDRGVVAFDWGRVADALGIPATCP